MARWWSHSGGRVAVAFGGVVDHIASLALAVPALPEILQLPRPLGTRRAAKRAAHRRRCAGQRAATIQQVVKSTEQEVQSSLQMNESSEQVGPDVIQEVVHESKEVAADICEDVAEATWESAVEMRVAKGVVAGSDPEAGSASHQATEKIYLGKLNRLPGELLRELASGPALQPCRRALEAEGFPWKLSSGALMFVSPCQHVDAMTALADEQLHPDSIIFAESMEYLIDEVLCQHGTWMKDRSTIGMDGMKVKEAMQIEDETRS